jgi:hypothetical protein
VLFALAKAVQELIVGAQMKFDICQMMPYRTFTSLPVDGGLPNKFRPCYNMAK